MGEEGGREQAGTVMGRMGAGLLGEIWRQGSSTRLTLSTVTKAKRA